MRAEERQLEVLEEEYWRSGGADGDLARKVVQAALGAKPRSPKLLARALQIAERAELPSPLRRRVEDELVAPAKRMCQRLALLDALGDENLPVAEAVFDYLVPALDRVDLTDVDLDGVKSARAKAANRPQAAKALLYALGWQRLPQPDVDELRLLANELCGSTRNHQARGLVVVGDSGEGLSLGVSVFSEQQGGVHAKNITEPAMQTQGQLVLLPYAAEHGVGWALEWPLTYAGSSIGLALKVAAMCVFENVANDPLLAATGRVDESGAVRWVDGIREKLIAARDGGFRRVLLPGENREQVEALGLDELPQLLYVSHVDEVRPQLAHAGAKSDFSLGGRTRYVAAAMRAAGLDEYGEHDINYGKQFRVADAQGEATVQVYERKVTVGGQGSASALARQVLAKLFGDVADNKRQPRRWKVMAEPRRERLRQTLEVAGAVAQQAKGQSEQWRYVLQRPGAKAQLTQWTTGTLMLQGDGDAYDEVVELVEGQLAGLANTDVTPPTKAAGPSIPELPRDVPWAGTDESGKGDYFGPLVSAAVIVDAGIAEQLDALGVRDSKKLSDRRVNELAPKLRRLLAGRYDLTPIPPRTYNKLYEEMRRENKNLNTLLAWGHARSIEDLLRKGIRPDYVIVDQFADASYIERKLLSDTRESGIRIIQFPKAEADLAVAAASILAREAFLAWLAKASRQLGMVLPKGASPQVIEAARQIVAARGEPALGDYAKLSFKTTQKVLAA